MQAASLTLRPALLLSCPVLSCPCVFSFKATHKVDSGSWIHICILITSILNVDLLRLTSVDCFARLHKSSHHNRVPYTAFTS
jgi:hypothetical protein